MARHGFITRLAEGGVPLARVARLAGHNDTNTVMRHYYHPDTESMLDDVAKVDAARASGGAGGEGPVSSPGTSTGA
jgi:integrase